MKKFRAIAAYAIVALTVAAFIFYAVKNPKLWTQLSQVNIFIVILLIALYFLSLGAIVLVYYYTLELCNVKMPSRENFRLTAYSLIINFFGPLQSGPGFRAVYLKAKYKLTFKRFILASLLYYLFFGVISVFFALSGSAYWRWSLLFLPLVIIFVAVVFKTNIPFVGKWLNKKDGTSLNMSYPIITKLAIATLLQVILVSAIYFIELKTVSSTISLRQAISYSGVANLTIFVAITPGGIGIREAFLLLSQKLHHIPPHTIIAASFLDRAVDVAFLGILFVITISLHFKEKLDIKKAEPVKLKD